MNLIIDQVPNAVTIGNQEYRLNTDFRNSILFELLIKDRDLTEQEKVAAAIHLYFPVVPPIINTPEGKNEVLEKILWFYRCGQEVKQAEGGAPTVEAYSFEHDGEYIFSAFYSQYNIDLSSESLHWWKFRALFKSLHEDHLISKIMGYRTMKIDKDMNDKDKKFYRKMKTMYRIPDDRSPEEIEADFSQSMDNMF